MEIWGGGGRKEMIRESEGVVGTNTLKNDNGAMAKRRETKRTERESSEKRQKRDK